MGGRRCGVPQLRNQNLPSPPLSVIGLLPGDSVKLSATEHFRKFELHLLPKEPVTVPEQRRSVKTCSGYPGIFEAGLLLDAMLSHS